MKKTDCSPLTGHKSMPPTPSYLPPIETRRLQSRSLKPSDFDSWLPFFTERSGIVFWEGLPDDPRQACRDFFEKTFERYHHGTGGLQALLNKETGLLVGVCGLLIQEVVATSELEVAYSILPAHRLNGYATEAARACRDAAFAKGWARSLISIIHSKNVPSQRVAQKNGMQFEKKLVYKNNPVHIYRIRDVDYFNKILSYGVYERPK